MQYVITRFVYCTHKSKFLAFPCLLSSSHFPFKCFLSSLLVSSFSFYLNKTLKIGGWWLKSLKDLVCSSIINCAVTFIRKPRRRNSIIYHPPLNATHPGLSSLLCLSFCCCCYLFLFLIEFQTQCGCFILKLLECDVLLSGLFVCALGRFHIGNE